MRTHTMTALSSERIVNQMIEATRWRANAACAGRGPLFDAVVEDRKDRVAAQEAIDICATCPVTQDCLDAALEEEAGLSTRDRHGIRGGLTPAQRRNLAAGTKRKPLKPCGTYAAYRRHHKFGEEPCEPCREAARRLEAQKRAKRKRAELTA